MTAEKAVTRKKLTLRTVVPAKATAVEVKPAVPEQALKSVKLKRLDDALCRLRTRLREDADLIDAIEKGVHTGSSVQIRVTLGRKSTGGVRAKLDIRRILAIGGFAIPLEDAATQAANDDELELAA